MNEIVANGHTNPETITRTELIALKDEPDTVWECDDLYEIEEDFTLKYEWNEMNNDYYVRYYRGAINDNEYVSVSLRKNTGEKQLHVCLTTHYEASDGSFGCTVG